MSLEVYPFNPADPRHKLPNLEECVMHIPESEAYQWLIYPEARILGFKPEVSHGRPDSIRMGVRDNFESKWRLRVGEIRGRIEGTNGKTHGVSIIVTAPGIFGRGLSRIMKHREPEAHAHIYREKDWEDIAKELDYEL